MRPISPVQLTLRLGTPVYAVLAVLAGVFYVERMANLDMAFQTFHILRTGALQIQSGRFGAAATQVFAWTAQALGLPLKGVLLSYSIGHVLYPFLVFIGITLGLRQWKWGLVLLLVSTVMTAHTFYWLSEMPQGLTFLILVFAWLHYRERIQVLAWWEYPLLTAALFTAFYFHPMVLYGMLFCTAFFLLRPNPPAGWRALHSLAAVIFIAAVLVKYKILKLDWYDAMSLERSKVFAETWPHWFDIKSNRDFLRWCLSDYYFIPLLLGVNVVFYVWKRLWLKAALAAFFPAAYILLVNVPFHQGDNQFYLENLYLPLGIFVSVPLVFDVLPALLPERRYIPALAPLLLVCAVHIYQSHEPWTRRLQWEEDFLEKTARLPKRKLLVPESLAPMDTLILSWGTAYEFAMLSALAHPDSVRCILVDESPERFDSVLVRPDLFLGEFRNYPFQALPERYFHFRDTSGYVRWNP